MKATPELVAETNFFKFSENPYPGRIILVGLDENGNMIQLYCIMGRSPNSRNRIFVYDKKISEVRTAPADPSKVEDASLIIYPAMCENHGIFAVSNGHQTEDALDCASNDVAGLAGLMFAHNWEYEPDAPNFTPRITAVCDFAQLELKIELSIFKKSLLSDECDHHIYRYNDLKPGFGYGITTYNGDGNPLPSFTGDPILLPLVGSIEEIANKYWAGLNEDNKVALVVKRITPERIKGNGESEVFIINKYQPVSAG